MKPQTADGLGRSLDNLRKDIRTVAIGVAGVGDSSEVYALKLVLNNVTIPMNYQGSN